MKKKTSFSGIDLVIKSRTPGAGGKKGFMDENREPIGIRVRMSIAALFLLHETSKEKGDSMKCSIEKSGLQESDTNWRIPVERNQVLAHEVLTENADTDHLVKRLHEKVQRTFMKDPVIIKNQLTAKT